MYKILVFFLLGFLLGRSEIVQTIQIKGKRHIGDYLRYLIILLFLTSMGIFIMGRTTFAYSTSFDSYASGTAMNTFGWTGDGNGYATGNHSVTYPNSALISISTGQSEIYYATSSKWETFSFNYYLHQKTTAPDTFFRVYDTATTSGRYIFALRLKPLRAGADAIIGNNALATSTTVKDVLAYDTWYNIQVEYDPDLEKVRAQIDTGGWSAWVGLGFTYTYSDYLNFNCNNGNTAAMYIDDVSAQEGSTDDIFINEPIEAATYSLTDFLWNIDWNISQTTKADTNYDALFVEVQYLPPGFATSTTISYDINDIADVSADTIYNITDNQVADIPQYLGAYSATARLWAIRWTSQMAQVRYLLASDSVNFTIGTSSDQSPWTAANTAWCSSMCQDLDPGLTNPVDYLYCAGRYLGCWALTPTNGSINYLKDGATKIGTKFPFKIVVDARNAVDTASESATGTVAMPTWTILGQTHEIIDVDVIRGAVGTSTVTTVRTTSGYAIYLITLYGLYLFAMSIL